MIKQSIFIFLLSSSVLFAEEDKVISWGIPPTLVYGQQTKEKYAEFEVIFDNKLSVCDKICSDTITDYLIYNDIRILVTINFGSGDIPDEITLEPEGLYYSVPSKLIVEDKTKVKMFVYPELMS